MMTPSRSSALCCRRWQWGVKIDGNAISTGLQWAAIGIDLPPKPAIRLHIQAADATSAARSAGS